MVSRGKRAGFDLACKNETWGNFRFKEDGKSKPMAPGLNEDCLVSESAGKLPQAASKRVSGKDTTLLSVCVLRASNMSGRSSDEEPTWLPVSPIAGITCAMRH